MKVIDTPSNMIGAKRRNPERGLPQKLQEVLSVVLYPSRRNIPRATGGQTLGTEYACTWTHDK